VTSVFRVNLVGFLWKFSLLFIELFLFPDLRFLFVFLLGSVGEHEPFPRRAVSVCRPMVLPIGISFSAR
jgi:hypothetical protein